MPRVVRSEVVVTQRLSPAERDALVGELAPLLAEIFGVSADDTRMVVEPKSKISKILLHRDEQGKLVGYFAIHFFEKHLRGEPTTIIRSGVGMLRAYRGQNTNMSWALRVLSEHVIANPGKPLYGLGAMVHPTSYMQIDRYVNQYWPKAGEPVPRDILAFMLELADEFHMVAPDPARPLVRRSAYGTRETEAERSYWAQCDRPAARFFVAMNPNYGEGLGVLTLFPINASMIASAAARFARDKATRVVEAALATAQRTPIGAYLLRPGEVRRRLAAVPLFAALDGASLAALVDRAEIVSMPGQRFLFREGDAGDEMYLLARGAVQVIAGAGDAEVMIDQLGAGAFFGEIAVLAGGRRSASIRTAIPSTLVRIPGDALRSLMAERAEMRDAIWGALAARIFDDHLRAGARSRRAPELDRAARQAWIRRGRHEEVEPGASVRTEGDAFLVLLHGAALIEQGGAQISAQAPLVIDASAPPSLVTKTKARVVHVPPLRG